MNDLFVFWGALFLREKLVCESAGWAAAHRAVLSYSCASKPGKPVHGTVTLPLSPLPRPQETTSVFFFLVFFLALLSLLVLALLFRPLKASESAEPWGSNKAEESLLSQWTFITLYCRIKLQRAIFSDYKSFYCFFQCFTVSLYTSQSLHCDLQSFCESSSS